MGCCCCCCFSKRGEGRKGVHRTLRAAVSGRREGRCWISSNIYVPGFSVGALTIRDLLLLSTSTATVITTMTMCSQTPLLYLHHRQFLLLRCCCLSDST